MAEKAITPFDYVTALGAKKPTPSPTMEGYNSYIVNRALAYHAQSLIAANEMNSRHWLPNDLQFVFLQRAVPPGRRWAKWVTAKKDPDLDLLAEVYFTNSTKSQRILRLLTSQQLDILRSLFGGLEDNDNKRKKRTRKSS